MHSISMHNHHQLPCLHCHPHSYIRTVQHLIERCLLLRMSRDQCIKALAEHARIWPLSHLLVISLFLSFSLPVVERATKENREFFQAYFHAISLRPCMSKP
ncbi:hypothetical protein CK203_018569 [Vitis vinifera]|uniref:Uncharacterized protein n=1 Tax=Vitis vinifera TaxID=29760 RepID=A0A438J5Q8_VITVI|nr:hypothetical protein CK203_018569 [Vitis vinifera]